MTAIRTISEAQFAAQRNNPDARDFEPFTDDAGVVVGWTFSVDLGRRFGWILVDRRVSPAFEPLRSYAEDYARLNIRA